MTTTITDATALAWFDQFRVIDGDRLCPEMALIFADYLESGHELGMWADCLRWMVKEGKQPAGLTNFWRDADRSPDVDTAKFWEFCAIPGRLIDLIGRDHEHGNFSKGSESKQAAFLAVMKVWHLREAS